MLLCSHANLKCALPSEVCIVLALSYMASRAVDATSNGFNRAGQLCVLMAIVRPSVGHVALCPVLCAHRCRTQSITTTNDRRQTNSSKAFRRLQVSTQAARSFAAVSLSGVKVRSAFVFAKQCLFNRQSPSFYLFSSATKLFTALSMAQVLEIWPRGEPARQTALSIVVQVSFKCLVLHGGEICSQAGS